MAAYAAEHTRKRTGTGSSIAVEDVVEEYDDEEKELIVISEGNKEGTMDSDTSDDEGGVSSLIPGDSRFFTARARHVPWRTRYFTSKKNRWMLALFVLALFLSVVVLSAVALGIWDQMKRQSCRDVLREEEYAPYIFDSSLGELDLCHQGEPLFHASLGIGRSFVAENIVDRYEYTPDATLYLSRHNVSHDHCIRIEWVGESSVDTPLMDCFELQEGEMWYGGYETHNQTWPMNSDSRPMTPFLPRDYLMEPMTSFGPILHPVWFSTRGVAVFVDKDVPLHVSINDLRSKDFNRQICFQSRRYSVNCLPKSLSNDPLRYTVCGFEDITMAVKFFLNASSEGIYHPRDHPSLDVFKRPIWSMKTDISQEKIIEFARNIVVTHNYSISQLEIDDMYSDHYGDLEFSTTKFPDYSELVSSLASINVKNITAWVHPFLNPDSNNFTEATENILPGTNIIDGNSIALARWWNGYGAVINFVNESTRLWHGDRLTRFVDDNQLSSLVFDAGDETYIPRCVYVEGMTHPAQYSQAYVEFVSNQTYASRAEVRVGYFSQAEPLFFRILDRNSAWGLDNGLQSVLTTMLSLGIAGYPFVLPDVVGGNGEPSKQLFIRWLQLSAYLPVMKLSYPPWSIDQETADITKKFIDIHEEVHSEYILPLIKESVKRGFPIIRPLWWRAPKDLKTYPIKDQFLVGNSLLVAPILEESDDANIIAIRTVYFPEGSDWICLSRPCTIDKPYSGGSTSKPFDVALSEILVFKAQ